MCESVRSFLCGDDRGEFDTWRIFVQYGVHFMLQMAVNATTLCPNLSIGFLVNVRNKRHVWTGFYFAFYALSLNVVGISIQSNYPSPMENVLLK